MPDDQTLSQIADGLLGAPLRIVVIVIGAAILNPEGIEIPFPQQTVWHRAVSASWSRAGSFRQGIEGSRHEQTGWSGA